VIPLYLRPVDNVYLRRERDTRVIPFLIASLLVLLPAILLLLLLVHWQNEIYKIGYELSVLEHNRAKLENRKLSLLAEKEHLSAPARLDQLAMERGLVPPEPEQVVIPSGP